MQMKLLMENWRQYVNEIGDASLPPYPSELYDVEEAEGEVRYRFTTDENDLGYLVEFSLRDWDFWRITYYDQDLESMAETGEGNPLRIMSTIVAIVKKFSESDLSQNIRSFRFEGIPKVLIAPGKDPFAFRNETTRTKLYLAFLRKNMPPGTDLEISGIGGNKIAFTLPPEERS